LCGEAQLPLSVLPWANALVPAVVASWFDTSDFRFVGFLPKKKGKQTLINEIIASPIPVFFYESVHRIEKTLLKFQESGFTGKVSIAREITKMHEQLITADISTIISLLDSGVIVKKWEFVVGVIS
jgi:16S rRNA (cytidine1402-2'-O)-methyltransferase